MEQTLQKALSELADIDGKIEALSKRRVELRQFVELYQKLYGSGANAARTLGIVRQVKPTRKGGGNKGRIVAAVREILSDGTPRQTRALLEELSKRGLEIGAANKVIGLSSILTRDKQTFVSSRAEGWSLKKVSPGSVGAPSGLFTTSSA